MTRVTPITPAPTLLELKNVNKVYGSSSKPLQVLFDIDLLVRGGEYLAIVGPSGSGKSTLMNIIGCLDRPTQGSYLFSGEEVESLTDNKLSKLRNDRIGFIFQSFQLVHHLTVIENVELPLFYAQVSRTDRRKRAEELLGRVGLSDRLHHLPSELSGGECQRVAIARSLSNDPDLILADEPTGNLDSVTSQDILAIFDDLHSQGRTIVMITHDLEIAQQAPRRIAILDGRIESDNCKEKAA